MRSIDKYIDLDQFPKNKNGTISWKNSVGVIAEFYIDGARHVLEIIERDKAVLLIKIDNDYFITTDTTEIKSVNFTRQMRLAPVYYYNVGQEIDNIVITEQFTKKRKNHGKYRDVKMYKCTCKVDGHQWTVEEKSLKSGSRCPLCAKNITVSGKNDVSTLRPDLIMFFENKNDAKTTSCFSMKKVSLKCPFCGYVSQKNISTLVTHGFSCPMCSDGVSYPNKFSRNLFLQLSNQYNYYEYEWSPEWAGLYKYDNYIELKDGTKLVIEMDGSQHYKANSFFSGKNSDKEKDFLANLNDIIIIRIDCNYPNVENRFLYIKNNFLNELQYYFDFSNINWEECAIRAEINLFQNIVNEFNKNPNVKYHELAKSLCLKTTTVTSSLHRARKLGLCGYKQENKAVALCNADSGHMHIFKTVKELSEAIGIAPHNIRSYCNKNKTIKNYTFRYATREEYLAFVEKEKQQIA